jgi:hypothetical protein
MREGDIPNQGQALGREWPLGIVIVGWEHVQAIEALDIRIALHIYLRKCHYINRKLVVTTRRRYSVSCYS